MNFEFIYNQMVRILHCNICIANNQGDIEKIYGNISGEQNPLLTDEPFRLQLLQRMTSPIRCIPSCANCSIIPPPFPISSAIPAFPIFIRRSNI